MDDEQTLLLSARNGDLDAFNELILRYQDLLFNLAFRVLADGDAAADAVQNALISAYLHFADFRNGSFRSWLMRITVNMCYDEIRRKSRRPTLPFERVTSDGQEFDLLDWLPNSSPSTEYLVETSELERTLQSALHALPPLYRAVAVLVDVEGHAYDEAACILGVPVGTIKSRLARARAHLRVLLGGEECHPSAPLWFNIQAEPYRLPSA
ncbi:MAG: RNA polymerase sigma factor [Chloroflexota bacterium]